MGSKGCCFSFVAFEPSLFLLFLVPEPAPATVLEFEETDDATAALNELGVAATAEYFIGFGCCLLLSELALLLLMIPESALFKFDDDDDTGLIFSFKLS